MRLKYAGVHAGVHFRLPDGRQLEVEHGKTVDVPDEVGRSMLEQADNWKPADADARKAHEEITKAAEQAANDESNPEEPTAPAAEPAGSKEG